MIIVKTNITITQVPSKTWPNRRGVFTFNFVCEYEANDGWEDLTNQGKITLPKDIKYIDQNGKPVYFKNPDANIGGFSSNPPTFLRGDEVIIKSGYEGQQLPVIFAGFISKVGSKKPFTLECEDNMWKLKQTPAIGGFNGVFAAAKYNVEDMIRELFNNAKLPYTVYRDLKDAKVNLGIDFRVDNETIGQVLERLRKDFWLKSYFRGDYLRTGSKVYIDTDVRLYDFTFQENIIEDDLEYRRRDDVVLSAIATSNYSIRTGGTTKDGHAKTKQQKLQVLITYEDGKFKSTVKPPGSNVEFPENNNGERHDFYFPNISDPEALIKKAQGQLERYYYTGFRGTFTTFGSPWVRMGDNVNIADNVLPERNGIYKVKKVEYKGGTGGLRQVIHLDYKVPEGQLS